MLTIFNAFLNKMRDNILYRLKNIPGIIYFLLLVICGLVLFNRYFIKSPTANSKILTLDEKKKAIKEENKLEIYSDTLLADYVKPVHCKDTFTVTFKFIGERNSTRIETVEYKTTAKDFKRSTFPNGIYVTANLGLIDEQMKIGDDTTTEMQTYGYDIYVEKTGKYTIGPASIFWQGVKIESAPFTINVLQ